MSISPHLLNMYKLKKPVQTLSTIPSVPPDDEQIDDTASDESTATWKSDASAKSHYSTASSACSLNNNHIHNRPTTAFPQDEQPHLQQDDTCPPDKNSNQTPCINFYEDDEVCRINKLGRLEFGIVGKSVEKDNEMRIFWTLDSTVQEEIIDPENSDSYTNIRLVDRRFCPGDIIQVNRKRGEVLQVSWACYIQILDNNLNLLNISCDNLDPLIPYHVGQKIEHSGWLGTVTTVNIEATLMFTGVGRTGIVDCAYLPSNQQPYPGRKVKYTVDRYIEAKLRFIDDDRSVTDVFNDYHVVEAFVLFTSVANVEVKWSGRIKAKGVDSKWVKSETITNPSQQPPTTLTKSNLKKHARVLGTIKDVDWENCNDCGERLYQYNARDDDIVLWDGDVEDYLRAKLFDEDSPQPCACVSVKDLRRTNSKICTNVAYNVKILRLSRVVEVKWTSSGKIEKIPASTITEKKSLNVPINQIVQQCLPLAPYSTDVFGVTLSCDSNEIVQVQWIQKSRDCNRSSSSLSTYSYERSHQTPEPLYNLEPHYAFGGLVPRAIVYRSMYCRISDALFTLGWVRSITPTGSVMVVSVHTKQEHALSPLDLDTTGLTIDGSSTNLQQSRYTDLVKQHGLNTLRTADKIFMRNLSIPDSSTYFPEHFTLLQKCSTNHTFYKNRFSVRSDGMWMRAVKRDQMFLTTRMNEDIGSIWIKGFRDRLDLFSVLISAPPGTPYEGIVYSLDLQLIPEYPNSPPQVYLHTAIGRLQPGIQNLELHDNIMAPYSLVDSLSALQTMLFISTESFDIPSSAASLERRATLLSKGNEDRLANARIIIDVLDLMFRSVMDPPKLWATEVINYFLMTFGRTKDRLHGLLDMTNPYSTSSSDQWIIPTFPLMPVSDGFTESVLIRLSRFDELIAKSAL